MRVTPQPAICVLQQDFQFLVVAKHNILAPRYLDTISAVPEPMHLQPDFVELSPECFLPLLIRNQIYGRIDQKVVDSYCCSPWTNLFEMDRRVSGQADEWSFFRTRQGRLRRFGLEWPSFAGVAFLDP